MVNLKKQKSKGYEYQVLTEQVWDEEKKKYVTKTIASLGRDDQIQPTVTVWSDAHTVGHLILNHNNPLVPTIPFKAQGTIKLPCQLIEAGKFRHGKPRWWCCTHQIHYGTKEDLEKRQCRNADFELRYTYNPWVLDVEKYPGGVGVWAALPPFISINRRPSKHNNQAHPILGIHVHCRKHPEGKKDIDATFPAIVLHTPDPLKTYYEAIHVSQPAALAYLISKEMELTIETLKCKYCGTPHCDLGFFAQTPHKKHLCGNCGQMFQATQYLSISNPLVEVAKGWEENERVLEEATGHLDIISSHYPGGVEIWTTTPAILWRMNRPEIINGIHVHCYLDAHRRAVDETFSTITLDGEFYDRERLLGDFLERYQYKRPKRENMFVAHPDDVEKVIN